MLHPIFRAILCITKKPEYKVQNSITFPVLSRKYWSNLRKSTDKSHIVSTQKSRRYDTKSIGLGKTKRLLIACKYIHHDKKVGNFRIEIK